MTHDAVIEYLLVLITVAVAADMLPYAVRFVASIALWPIRRAARLDWLSFTEHHIEPEEKRYGALMGAYFRSWYAKYWQPERLHSRIQNGVEYAGCVSEDLFFVIHHLAVLAAAVLLVFYCYGSYAPQDVRDFVTSWIHIAPVHH